MYNVNQQAPSPSIPFSPLVTSFVTSFPPQETTPPPGCRTETDSMGPMYVEHTRYYGAQTVRGKGTHRHDPHFATTHKTLFKKKKKFGFEINVILSLIQLYNPFAPIKTRVHDGRMRTGKYHIPYRSSNQCFGCTVATFVSQPFPFFFFGKSLRVLPFLIFLPLPALSITSNRRGR